MEIIIISFLIYPILQFIFFKDDILWINEKFKAILVGIVLIYIKLSNGLFLQSNISGIKSRWLVYYIGVYFVICLFNNTENNLLFSDNIFTLKNIQQIIAITIYEEIIFRGIILSTLITNNIYFNYVTNSVIVSLMFVVHHFFYFKPSFKFLDYYIFLFFVSQLFNSVFISFGILGSVIVHLVGNIIFIARSR